MKNGEMRKRSIKLLKKLEKTFQGDFLLSGFNLPLTSGVDDNTFKALKILEKNGLIIAKGYKLEGLPGPEKEKKLEVPQITLTGLEFLNGLKQRQTNRRLVILTILMAVIGVVQIFLLLK